MFGFGEGDTSTAQNALNGYQASLNLFTGNAGYQNSLQQGMRGADVASSGASRQAAKSARTTGASAGAASDIAAQKASEGYYQQLQPQQQSAAQMGLANLGGYKDLHSLALNQTAADFGYDWTKLKNYMNLAGTLIGTMGNMMPSGGAGGAAAGAK